MSVGYPNEYEEQRITVGSKTPRGLFL
uniref:Uncharacterized protein n=1 Tax=Moniliophthora roreri TaxID=221103 RepID=A0A0W0GEQ0_MONRR